MCPARFAGWMEHQSLGISKDGCRRIIEPELSPHEIETLRRHTSSDTTPYDEVPALYTYYLIINYLKNLQPFYYIYHANFCSCLRK